jgi:hypothetical protein
LKKRINNNKDKILNFSIEGDNWGLACNSLHFIDLAAYLLDSDLISVTSIYVDKLIYESKRIGFIELNGTIIGQFSNDTLISLSSFRNEIENISKEIYITISTKKENILICEGPVSTVLYKSKTNQENNNLFEKFELNLQSELTKDLANDIFLTKKCQLPTLTDALSNHVTFIKIMLDFYNHLNNSRYEKMPIT